MPSSKIFPNIISLNAAIAACEKGNQWLLALQFLRSPRETTLRPDVISFSSGLSACATQGQWRWALEVYGRMGQREMDVISCNAAGILEWFFWGCGWSSQQSSQQIRGSVE